MKLKNKYPDNNPKTVQGLKKTPLHLVPPALERGAAEAFANGAAKYGPYNWRIAMISSSVYYAACKRHLDDWWDRVDRGDLAPDSFVHHLKHAAACIAMLLDTMGSPLLNDDRPPRVEHYADTRVKGKKQGQRRAPGKARVLALPRAKRNGKPGARLPRVPARGHHAGNGGANHRSVRQRRNKGAR